MKKALFLTKQQVELPPSYNSHTQNKQNKQLAETKQKRKKSFGLC